MRKRTLSLFLTVLAVVLVSGCTSEAKDKFGYTTSDISTIGHDWIMSQKLPFAHSASVTGTVMKIDETVGMITYRYTGSADVDGQTHSFDLTVLVSQGTHSCVLSSWD